MIRLTLLMFICSATALGAETELERVLRLIKSRPDLSANQIYINAAMQTLNALDESKTVDTSIQVMHFVSEKEVATQKPMDLQLETAAIGATNTGMVRLTESAPDYQTSLLIANAADARVQVQSSAVVLTNLPLAESSEISTSAIGSANVGVIQIGISDAP